MINILLSRPDFNGVWAQEYLTGILHQDMHVLIVPLYGDAGWSAEGESFEHHYHRGSRAYEQIVLPFRVYQIKDSDIRWFNPYQDDREILKNLLKQSDVVYLCGSDPDVMMRCIDDHALTYLLRQYRGIYMGNAAGSKVLMDEFYPMDEWNEEGGKGLGILNGFTLETGYIEDVVHLRHIIRSIEEKGRAVFGCPEKGGILIQDGHYDLMGDAFICSEDDLDRIYHAYEDAKSRLEYYGDNGNW
jgi:hypothetical protein